MAVADRLISGLARRQHAVVAAWQLLRLGLSHTELRRRVNDGRLRVIHRGVYAVGPITQKGAWLAAVLACGAHALLSHREASALHRLRQSNRSKTDVSVPRSARTRPGIDVHVTRSLRRADRTVVDGIPVTSLARTLLDLAEVVSPTQLQRAYEEAERLRVLDITAMRELLDRSNGRRGVAALRALLAYDPEPASGSKSDLESMFLDLVREAGLPLPQVNVVVGGYEVDAYWPGARLVVELQSYGFHSHRRAFERDHAKLARLKVAGYEPLALTHRQLRDESEWVAAAVRRLLDGAVPDAVL